MSVLDLAMIAIPRQAQSLERAVTNLRKGGFVEPLHIFAEPGLEAEAKNLPEEVTVTHNWKQMGAKANWMQALAHLAYHCEAEHLLLVEDDVEFCRGARRQLDKFLDSGQPYGMLSLCTMVRERRQMGTKKGWLRMPRGQWGTQAICFSRQGALDAVRHPDLLRGDPMSCPYDLRVREVLLGAHWDCYTHVPSLCEHVGYEETTIDKPSRYRPSASRTYERRGLDYYREFGVE